MENKVTYISNLHFYCRANNKTTKCRLTFLESVYLPMKYI